MTTVVVKHIFIRNDNKEFQVAYSMVTNSG